MPRPDPRAPKMGQESLFEPESTATVRDGQVLRGRHSEAIDRAIAAARAAEIITDVDEAAATLLRAGGWSLDAFEAQNKPYGPSKLMQGMNEALRELHMTPESRGGDTDDAIAELMTQMGEVEVEEDDEAPIPHTED